MGKITLHDAVKPEYFKKDISFSCIVSGKSVIPYQIPKKVHIRCPRNQNRCNSCEIRKHKGKITIDPDIRFITTNEAYFDSVLKKILDVNCSITAKVLEVYTVEELYLSSPLSSKDRFSSSRLAYYIGHDIPCNVEIEVKGYTIPEPKQQKAVHIITEYKAVKTDIDNFKMTRELNKGLKIFRPSETSVNSIYDKLEELYEIYSKNVTKIYKRFDLHMAIDLIFHSPLTFYLGNEYVNKGWGDMMVLGDTRCGKGFVAESLIKYYEIGDLVSGENVSIAGLIGGVQQVSGRWILTWGKIPLNDRRLIVIDEAGDMADILTKLSRVRSEGVAEITKIKTETNYARTRLIMLANPKNRVVSSYTYGIESLTGVIPNAEDISRFDYVLIVANDEVSLKDINKYHPEIKNPYIKFDNTLIRWIWSRKSDQIVFSKSVIEVVMEYAIKLGKIYSSQIPLIQGENIRIKLAKISVMIAARLFSASKDGEDIVVKADHVKCAYIFLNMIYKKTASSYYYYSQVKKTFSEIKDIEKLDNYIRTFSNYDSVIDYLVQSSYITPTDMSDYINQPKEVVRELISELLKHNCIQKKWQYYTKNPAFNAWLKTARE